MSWVITHNYVCFILSAHTYEYLSSLSSLPPRPTLGIIYFSHAKSAKIFLAPGHVSILARSVSWFRFRFPSLHAISSTSLSIAFTMTQSYLEDLDSMLQDIDRTSTSAYGGDYSSSDYGGMSEPRRPPPPRDYQPYSHHGDRSQRREQYHRQENTIRWINDYFVNLKIQR